MTDFMKEADFRYLSSRNSYQRKTDYGFDQFNWVTDPVCPNPRGHLGVFGLSLRHDSIAHLTQDALPIYGDANKKNAFTIYRATGQYFPFDAERDAPLKLGFDSLNQDCAAAAERMKHMLIDDGFAWYRRYSNIESISTDLNRDIHTRKPNDPASHSIINNLNKIPVLGVAAACISEPKRVPGLLSDYLEHMGQWGGEAYLRLEQESGKLSRKFEQVLVRAREYGCAV